MFRTIIITKTIAAPSAIRRNGHGMTYAAEKHTANVSPPHAQAESPWAEPIRAIVTAEKMIIINSSIIHSHVSRSLQHHGDPTGAVAGASP